jgi:hypothetical protein
MKRLAMIAAALSLVAVLGCAAKEVLVPKSAVSSGIDLTGNWQLREDSETAANRIREAEFAAAGGNEPLVSRKKRVSIPSASVHVFLETGKTLKVTQTDSGLFISFDRAVVEEYRFGENREVSVGPITADRVSGWEGSAYVIETLDDNGAKLVEAYRLQDEGLTLQRNIRIVDKKLTQLNIEQFFERN